MDKKHTGSRPFHSVEEEAQTCFNHAGENRSEYKLALQDTDFLFRDEVRPIRIQMELMRPELVLSDHKINETIVFFGSARIPDYDVALKNFEAIDAKVKADPKNAALLKEKDRAGKVLDNSKYLEEAYKLSKMASEQSEWTVITGGGPSFMKAANHGAFDANKESVALGVVLPHEQIPNEYVTPELTFQFHYFAIRKMHFLMRARALIAFPGGFGTLDELFETLTLIQTEKMERIPLVLFNERFWRNILNFEALAQEGTIYEGDLSLIHYAEKAEEAWEIIKAYYE